MRYALLSFAFAGLLGGCASAQAPSVSDYRTDPQRGAALAEALCSACHATGKTDASPRAEAPPFRMLLNKLDAQNLTRDLKAGVAMAHPDLPSVHLTDRSSEDFVAYLETIKQR
jgi:mono/diheme cytochrome c family protein